MLFSSLGAASRKNRDFIVSLVRDVVSKRDRRSPSNRSNIIFGLHATWAGLSRSLVHRARSVTS
jgi:hypothetical protein